MSKKQKHLSITDEELENQIAILTMAEFEKFLQITYVSKVPALVYGAPGVGKTQAIRTLARALGSKCLHFKHPDFGKEEFGCLDFRLAYYDPTDLKGFPVMNIAEGYSEWLPSGFLPTEANIAAGRVPQFGICILEEIGLANEDTCKPAFQFLQERELNGEKIGDGWFFIATSNRLRDKSGAKALAAALGNRFAQIELRPVIDDLILYAREAGWWSPCIGFAKFRPGLIYGFDPAAWKLNTAFCSPRSMENTSRQIQAWIKVNKPSDSVPIPPGYVTKPLIGVAAALEFSAYLQAYEKIPDPLDVLAKPTKIKVPTEPSELWALTTALVDHINEENYKETYPLIDQFLQRCPVEFELATTREISAVTKRKILPLRTYMDHAIRHQEVYSSLS